MNYDLWLILLGIEASLKINLINRYESAENIYNDFEYLQNSEKNFNEEIKKLTKKIYLKKFIKLKKNYTKRE